MNVDEKKAREDNKDVEYILHKYELYTLSIRAIA